MSTDTTPTLVEHPCLECGVPAKAHPTDECPLDTFEACGLTEGDEDER